MKQQLYPTDLTNAQGKVIKPLLPQETRGRPRTWSQRKVLNAIWYIVVSGVQWRLLPRDYPRWQSVYYHFRRWSRWGYWKRVHHLLRALVRQKMGRHKHPTAGCMDSQSVKCTAVPGVRGFDSAKRLKGRKRHVLSDSQGLALELVVSAADVSDSQGARLVWQRLGGRRGVAKKMRRVWVDAGYKRGIQEWCAQHVGVTLQVVQAPAGQRGFAVQPHRWVIERTLGWVSMHRRLGRDYEARTDHSEAMCWIALARVLLRRLA